MPAMSNGKTWPSVAPEHLKKYKGKIKDRIQKIIMNVSSYNKFESVLIWCGAKLLINGKLAEAVLNKVTNSLKEHKLLE